MVGGVWFVVFLIVSFGMMVFVIVVVVFILVVICDWIYFGIDICV